MTTKIMMTTTKRSVAGFALALLLGGAALALWAPTTPGLVQSVNIEAAEIKNKEEEISDMSGRSESKWKAAEEIKEQLKAAEEKPAKAKGAERRLANEAADEEADPFVVKEQAKCYAELYKNDGKTWIAKVVQPDDYTSADLPAGADSIKVSGGEGCRAILYYFGEGQAEFSPGAMLRFGNGARSIKVIRRRFEQKTRWARPKPQARRPAEANLAGSECSLENNKKGCSEEECKTLKEFEEMSETDRSCKISELEESITTLKDSIEKKRKEAKDLGNAVHLVKLVCEKLDNVEQLFNEADFREHCGLRTCVLAFLPHSSGESKRQIHLEVVHTAFKKAKADGHNVGFMWLEGEDSVARDAAEKMRLTTRGSPAAVAVVRNQFKAFSGTFGVHRGTFDEISLTLFLDDVMTNPLAMQSLYKDLKFEVAEQDDDGMFDNA